MVEDAHKGTDLDADEAIDANTGSRFEKIAVTGGILGAIAASTCCVLPLALALLGVSGAWMSSLRALAPYQPLFVALAVGAIGYGFYKTYWAGGQACAADETCKRPASTRFVRSGLWLASVMVASVISFPYWFPLVEPHLP